AVGGNSHGSGQPIRITAHTFDPEADGSENEETARLAVDGNPSTLWHTDHYKRRDLGGLKSGVGLVFTAASAAKLHALQLISPTRGWRARVYVASAPASSLAGWGQPVATVSGTTGSVNADLAGGQGAAVLLWITDLGDGARGAFMFELAEAKLSS
ncbi:MAG: hypothetical protein JF603_15990, partial [Acidobacteria bacterium]|nr:hypothetical protein [Acidobacteriota bacterium]